MASASEPPRGDLSPGLLGAAGWFRIFTLALGTFFFAAGAVIIPGLMPYLTADFDRTPEDIGLLVPIYAIPLAILVPFITLLTRTWQRRTLLAIGLGLGVLGILMMVFAPTFEVALLSRVVSAVGGAAYMPAGFEVAALISPHAVRGRAVAIVTAGVNVATAFGAPIGTLVASGSSWRIAMAGVAGTGVLALVAVVIALAGVHQIPRLSLRERLGALRNTRTLLILIANFLALAGNYAAFVYFAYLTEPATLGDAGVVAALFTLYGVVSLVGTIVGGWVSDRLDPRMVFRLGTCSLMIAFAIVPIAVLTMPGAIAIIVMWALSAWISSVALVAFLAKVAPEGVSWNASVAFLGMGTSGLLGSAVLFFGDASVLTLALIPVLVGALICFELAARRSVRDG